jgi:serine/threonine-protein kinase
MNPTQDENKATADQTRVDSRADGAPVVSGSNMHEWAGPSTIGSSTGGPPSIVPDQVLFGHYRVKRLLGEGGMGSVWLVEDQHLKCERALKLIASDNSENPEARARFQREMQVMARVNHEHAVVIYTAELGGARAAIVMEYIQGESLNNILKSGRPITLEQASRIVEQLCSVLDVVHRQGIVHRDLKPSNLMLVGGLTGGKVFLKVLDFGIAKVLGADKSNTITHSKGSFLGTLPYMSPEQVIGKDVTALSDIYSTGVILYEILTGKRPFQGAEFKVMHDHVSTPRPPFREVAPKCRVPLAVEQVVMQCLEKEPARRPASARALALAFQKAAAPVAKPSPKPPAKSRGRAWGLVAGFAAVAILGAVASALLVGRGSSGTVPLEFDAPLDGLNVTVDGFAVDARQPLSLQSGVHTIVVTQGDFIAARTSLPVTAGANAPFQVGLRRRATVRFRPPSAAVLVDGEPQVLERDGSLSLVFAGRQPREVHAEAEGYTSLSESLTYDAVAARRSEFVLTWDQARLAEGGRSLLKQYCHHCHGVAFQSPGLDVLDRDAMTALPARGGALCLVPGKPGESAIWKQLEAGKMPPKDSKQPTPAEKDTLRNWIAAGAPRAGGRRRPFQTEVHVLTAIRDDLQNAAIGDRRFYRYFTLTHLFNNPAVDDDELALDRAALSKAINSLSRQSRIVTPRAIDAVGTVYRIDLRDLDWHRYDVWLQLHQEYPYGLGPTRRAGADRSSWELSREILNLCGSDRPSLRADWFVAQATRPPLYHNLLSLPETAAELERGLEINVVNDFQNDQVARAGLTAGGVSPQNQYRLLERHNTPDGYYWKSYDFRNADATSDLLRFPLGPAFEGNPFPDQVFQHTSSAILFSLPNGFLAYMLVDQAGKRIDGASTEVLIDPQTTAGSRAVVNGLSCMACHRLGVYPVVDEVRNGTTLLGDPLRKVEQIYPQRKGMESLVLQDRIRFRQALAAAIDPFVNSSSPDGAHVDVENVPEPIERLARRYRAGLTLADIACELGVEDVNHLRAQIQSTPALQRDLGSLAAGSTIARPAWESSSGEYSLFQNVAGVLDLGIPAPKSATHP